jgi:osmotically inducible protein OsmC
MAERSRVTYTAEAHVTGGRDEGHGRTSDGALEVDLRVPRQMGGRGGGTNPEQLFAIGYAACFETALAAVARQRRRELGDVAIDSRVMLLRTAHGLVLGVELAVSMPSVGDPNEAEALVRRAHEACPYSKATRGNIEVTLIANGRTIDDDDSAAAAA